MWEHYHPVTEHDVSCKWAKVSHMCTGMAVSDSMITKLRWIWVLRGFFEQAANGFWEGLGMDELTDFGGDFFQRDLGVV